MKKLIGSLFGLALVLALPGAAQVKLEWTTDFPAATARAKKENKHVLLKFTGSDWCAWCEKLEKDVFLTEAFGAYAKTNLVLVVLDFPSKQKQKTQSAELKKANRELQTKFNADGFPIVIVLDPSGKEAWRHHGYLAGGPKVWIPKLEELKKASDAKGKSEKGKK